MIQQVDITTVLATNIKILRESKDLTLDQLGEAIGVSRQAIWNLENEKSWITIDKVRKLAKFFKVKQHELFQVNTQSK